MSFGVPNFPFYRLGPLDTTCDSLHLAVFNSTEAAIAQVEWQVFPNPARACFTFNLVNYYPREQGKRIKQQKME